MGAFPNTTDISLKNLQSEQRNAILQYSHYRINAVKFVFYPKQNAVGATVGDTEPSGGANYRNGTTKGVVYTLFVNNRDQIYNTRDDMIRNPKHKIHMPFRPIVRYSKIRPQLRVAMGTNTSVDLMSGKNVFISTADLNCDYGRFIFCRDQDTLGTETAASIYTYAITYYVTMKNLNVN